MIESVNNERVKEIAKFKELFKDILAEENVDFNDM